MSPGLFSKEDTNCVFSIPRQMLPAKFTRNNTQAIRFHSGTLRDFYSTVRKRARKIGTLLPSRKEKMISIVGNSSMDQLSYLH